MAISGSVYSGSQFELYLGLQTGATTPVAMGTAGAVNGEFVKLDMASVSDIDFSGIVQDRNLRTGQQIKKPTDHYASQNGATYTLAFEWVVSHKEGLLKLLQLISEDSTSAYSVAGTFSQSIYQDGATTGELATLIISNPNTSDDRVMHSAALTELNFSMDAGSDGGRLKVSGTFISGYNPTIGANTVVPSGTETAWIKTIHSCTTRTLGGSDIVAKSFNLNLSYPCVWSGSTANAEYYSRAGELMASGSINAKYDGNTDGEIAHFFTAAEKAIALGDGSTINFSCPQVIYTGYNTTFDGEEGAFVEVPFECVALGAELLYEITIS